MKLFLVALCTVSVVALVSGQGHSRGPPQRGQVLWYRVHFKRLEWNPRQSIVTIKCWPFSAQSKFGGGKKIRANGSKMPITRTSYWKWYARIPTTTQANNKNRQMFTRLPYGINWIGNESVQIEWFYSGTENLFKFILLPNV